VREVDRWEDVVCPKHMFERLEKAFCLALTLRERVKGAKKLFVSNFVLFTHARAPI